MKNGKFNFLGRVLMPATVTFEYLFLSTHSCPQDEQNNATSVRYPWK
jgi:hypothetical protein